MNWGEIRRLPHHDLRLLRQPLARERLLPELLPSPVRRASDVHHEPARGAQGPSARLSGAGPLLPFAARLRHPPPAAPRLLRHGARSALAAILLQRAADDAPYQTPLRRLRLPA